MNNANYEIKKNTYKLDHKKIRQNMKINMIKTGLTQRQLGNLIDAKPSTMSDRMTGKRDFTLDEVIKLMGIFGLSFEEIFLK
jgi:DNA-binding XRE family transcriptional regulator